MYRDSAQRDNSRSVQDADNFRRSFRSKSLLEYGRCVREQSHLQQLSAASDLEAVECPTLSVSLCVGNVITRQLKGSVELIQHDEQLGSPVACNIRPGVVASAEMGP